MSLRTLLSVALLAGCTPDPPKNAEPSSSTPSSDTTGTTPPDTPPGDTGTPPERTALDIALDDAFRIDPSRIDVVYDVTPTADTLEGSAVITFTMRPGEDQPLFHFAPYMNGQGEARSALVSLLLDGEPLDPQRDEDLRVEVFPGSTQESFVLQRTVGGGEHTMEIAWSIPNIYQIFRRDWFLTLVDDTVGHGNDSLWPTINSPEALARHTVEVRLHDPRSYAFVASGEVTGPTLVGDAQVWTLDTLREVASYTVLLAAMPADQVQVRQFDAGDVPVTLVSTEPPGRTDDAQDLTVRTVAQLEDDFGAFPMPSLSVLLLDWPDGMEYYGGTITGYSSLSHELVHMYWGCSAINRTWRDSWIDEAVNVWYEAHDVLPELPADDTSGIVGDRDVLELGFDGRAYGPGAMMFGAVADRMGGDDVLLGFLRGFRDAHVFVPYTTDELVEALTDETGDAGIRPAFEAWVGLEPVAR
ncbi:MAG: hypothetical protein R3F59_14250 [Myxococcota bacterium]